MAKQRILIVEDEDDICMILSYSLQKAGYETLIANSAEEALEKYQTAILNGEVDLILLDIMMGEMSGLELAMKALCCRDLVWVQMTISASHFACLRCLPA